MPSFLYFFFFFFAFEFPRSLQEHLAQIGDLRAQVEKFKVLNEGLGKEKDAMQFEINKLNVSCCCFLHKKEKKRI